MNTSAFYLIDKPIGYTSFDVLRILRKKLQMKKMGHTGTLDPLATGALLVATGNYTKLIPYFEKDSKEYEFTIQLNGVTESYDSETEVNYISDELQAKWEKTLTLSKLQSLLDQHFSGEIEQIPPKYSALKINGKKALDKIRAGEYFEMKKRKATIFQIEILDFHYPSVTLRASVSAGTYIRSIAHDLGQLLGTGGYISYLRRTKIDRLDVSESQDLDLFEPERYLNIETLFGSEKIIQFDDLMIQRLNQGLETNYPDFPYSDGEYFVQKQGSITNIVSYKKPILKPKRKI